MREYGFQPQEIAAFEDHRLVRILHDAIEGRKARSQAAKAQRHVTAQAAQPAARAGGGGAAPIARMDDRTSTDAWMKARNAQLRKSR